MRGLLDARGISLVELMVVMALVGVVATAVLSLFITTQRTASSSEEVVEVQQNLRFALDLMTQDLRMAGFMVNREERALDVAQEQVLTLRTSTAEGRGARISVGMALTGGDPVTFTVANAQMANLFGAGDQVRILRPPSQVPPVPVALTVDAVNPAARALTLSGLSGISEQIVAGDMIVRSDLNAVNTVTYCLDPAPGCPPAADPPCPPGHACIKRVVNGTDAEIVAAQIAPGGLSFTYFAEDGSATAELEEIRAVGIELTGQTVATATLAPAKVRALRSYVRLRNR